MEIRERIKELMKTRGWTEYKLAKAANLSQTTVSHLFKRQNAPTYPTVEAICGAFGITMSQFFAESGEPVVLTQEQEGTLHLWSSLSDRQKQIIESTMKEFTALD